MELKCLTQTSLDELKVNIDINIENGFYNKNEPWLNDYFKEEFKCNTGIDIKEFELIIPEENASKMQRPKSDVENCVRIHKNLKNLTIEQATDDRLWTYLTHITFWKYMKRRWPVEEKKNITGFLKERYFLKKNSDKSMLRNGLSRLWWMGYTTYDEDLENPYELTEFLLKDSDMQVGLMERAYSRNPEFLKNVLRAVKTYSENFEPPKMKAKRKLWEEINRVGGVKILDMLSYSEIYKIVEQTLKDN